MTLPDATPSTGRAPSGDMVLTIQYLRAVAASLVVLYHALWPVTDRPLGKFGIDLFFVISGFVMWMTTAQGQHSLSSFWKARIVRIVPLYWLFTTLYLAIALLVPEVLHHSALDPLFVVKSYLFIPAQHPELGIAVPAYTLGWTLNYEMFFYFVFGLGLLVRGRARRVAALLVVFLALVTAGRWMPEGPIASVYTNPLLLEFVAGILLAMLSPWLMRQKAMMGWTLVAVSIAWLAFVTFGGLSWSTLLGACLPAAGIVAGALVLEPLARRTPSRLGLLLGDASYSIYLAHPFGERVWLLAFTYARLDLTATMPAVFYVVVAVGAGIASGIASYFVIERPLLAAAHRRGARPRFARGTA